MGRLTGIMHGDSWRSIWELAKRDYQARYMGSFLGAFWTYAQPLLFMGMLYLLFSSGFRGGRATNYDYGVWLVAGYIAWDYFTDLVNALGGVFRQYRFLVKRGDFNIYLLPAIKVLSTIGPHLVFIGFAVALAWANGVAPTPMLLQLVFFLTCLVMFACGIGIIAAALIPFVPDVGNVVQVITRFGFWLTPIFWSAERLPEQYRWVADANPMYHVVTGYRNSIVDAQSILATLEGNAYLLAFSIATLMLGLGVLRRIRPHLGEVIR